MRSHNIDNNEVLRIISGGPLYFYGEMLAINECTHIMICHRDPLSKQTHNINICELSHLLLSVDVQALL